MHVDVCIVGAFCLQNSATNRASKLEGGIKEAKIIMYDHIDRLNVFSWLLKGFQCIQCGFYAKQLREHTTFPTRVQGNLDCHLSILASIAPLDENRGTESEQGHSKISTPAQILHLFCMTNTKNATAVFGLGSTFLGLSCLPFTRCV